MSGHLAGTPAKTSEVGWLHPFKRMQIRFSNWLEWRLPLSDNVLLTQRNVYILPTKPGWMLGFTLLVLLIASINYQLNLGYLLTFLLAGTALVGMHICHGTLRGLALNVMPPPAHYVGATATVSVKLTNSSTRTRYAIGLSLFHGLENVRPLSPNGFLEKHRSQIFERHWAWTDVPAQSSSTVQVAFTPSQRGLHHVPTLTAETRFPLGTFRVWTVWRPAAQIIVYPLPEAHPPPLPPGEPHAQGAGHALHSHTGEFDGVRTYRRGDPLKHVLWKKAAKASAEHADLVVRDAQESQHHQLWLDIRQIHALGLEQKLSRLCAWVLQAEQLGLDYGLRLPTLEIQPSSGEVHKRHCLEALATC